VTLIETGTLQSDDIIGADRFAVSNGFGYLVSTTSVSSGENDYLAIVDLSSLTIVSTLSDGHFANTPAVAVSGDYAYIVSAFHTHLITVDVSDKSAPAISGTPLVDTNFAGAHSIAVLGSHLYISRNDVSNPIVTVVSIETQDSPSIVTTITLEGTAPPTTLAAASDKLFIGSSSNKLYVYDISDPTNPSSISSLAGPSGCSYKRSSGLLTSESDLYMTANYHSLIAVSISDSPAHADCLENDEMQEVLIGYVSGEYLYTAAMDSDDAYRLLPIANSDPSALALASNEAISLTGTPLAIGGENDKIYVLNSQHTIAEITIQPTSEPDTDTDTGSDGTDTDQATTAEPATNTNADEVTSVSDEISKTEIQGNTAWWLLILITTCLMCFCVPVCAMINMKYVRPYRISRLERLHEASKLRKMQREEGEGWTETGRNTNDNLEGEDSGGYE